MKVNYRERKRLYAGVVAHALQYQWEFEQFLLLFYADATPARINPCGTRYCKRCRPDPIALMNASAKYFLGTLYYMLVDRTVLNVCRLTDPQFQGKHRNLSIYALHECSEYLAQYPHKAVSLIKKMESSA